MNKHERLMGHGSLPYNDSPEKPMYGDCCCSVMKNTIDNDKLYSRQLVCLGDFAGEKITIEKGNTLIGHEAGADIVGEDNIVIIGDGIRSLDKSQKDVLFIGDRVAIGKTLFGKPINLSHVIKYWRSY